MIARARQPWDERQQGADTIASTEDDVHRILHLTALGTLKIRSLRFVKDIAITKPIVIPVALRGLRIVATPGVRLIPSKVIAQAFKVQAENVSIIGVDAAAPSSSRVFSSFVTLDTAQTTDRFTLEGCHLLVGKIVEAPALSGSGSSSYCRVVGNHAEALFGGGLAIQAPGIYWLIHGNTVIGYADAIALVGVDAGFARIHANGCGGGSIDTTAGVGMSTIVGNVNAGPPLNTHATDAVGLNT